jgi:lysine 2,3-aminomutase
MDEWKELLRKSINDQEGLKAILGTIPSRLGEVISVYPMRINPYYFNLINKDDWQNDPIARQCIPDIKELTVEGGDSDPLSEIGSTSSPIVIHKYKYGVVYMVSNACAVYCRFCTRKRMVGLHGNGVSSETIASGLSYIKRNPSIKEVILSGGDPLLLDDEKIDDILGKLRKISHVEIIRIGSRTPVTLPSRITPELCSILKRYCPVYFNTHFNHPAELTARSRDACGLIADAGIPLGNQTVLLKGINDDKDVMCDLMFGLLKSRVRPYYLFQTDYIKGIEHFRTRVEVGIKIMDHLKRELPGLAVPFYVIDSPSGHGKIPLWPQYMCSLTKKEVVLKDLEGKKIIYSQAV